MLKSSQDRNNINSRGCVMNLKPYPEYKDSGVPLICRMPIDWMTHKLKNVASLIVSNVDKIVNENEQPVRLCNYVDVYKNDRM